MTIKQLGGVFGRNPTFNDVTIEGQLTFDGDVDINSDLKVDGDLEVSGDVDITSTTANPLAVVSTNASGAYASFNNGTQTSLFAGFGSTLMPGATSSDAVLRYDSNDNLYIARGSTKVATFNSTGSLEIANGNVVISTAGGGIDFSATAGPNPPASGTSELLDDYEIGQWTPTYTTTGTDFDSITYNFQYGEYVKIGQMVWCSFQFRTSAVTVGSASGFLRVGGLPFTVGTQSAGDTFGPVGTFKSFASGSPQVVSPVNGTTQMQVVSQDFTIQDYSIIGTGSFANWLQGDIIYLVN